MINVKYTDVSNVYLINTSNSMNKSIITINNLIPRLIRKRGGG